jgi:CDP-diacylglycerol--glycerol-3-phosphate 3-phosphatidyltransferase
MCIFIAAGLTDIADGYIARNKGQITDFGKFLDPLADKILVLAAMLWFVAQGTIPSWAAIIVVSREFLVTALRLLAIGQKRVMAAELSGKIKTLVTMICLTIMFLPPQQWVIYVCVTAILVTTVYSGIDYFVRNKDILKMEMK